MEVMSARWCLSTVVQTFETHGHVVSTVVTPLESKSSISSREAPKAGRMTTSPSLTLSKRLPPTASLSFSINSMSMPASKSLTPGLWMSSLVMCMVFSGYASRAAHASSMERSTPQQKPNSLASTKVILRLPSPVTSSLKLDSFICSTSSPANCLDIFCDTSLWMERSNGVPPRLNDSLLMIRLRAFFLVSISLDLSATGVPLGFFASATSAVGFSTIATSSSRRVLLGLVGHARWKASTHASTTPSRTITLI
mmetsp:Transcript_74659/g.148369  ORF Transcript_74659/g.148369 Transcript_74659/m.148369 type:complete len:253 (-) Transcript_74659:7-765(-)